MSTKASILQLYYNNNGQNSLAYLTEEENWLTHEKISTRLRQVLRELQKKNCVEISWGMVNREMGFDEAPTVRCSLKLT